MKITKTKLKQIIKEETIKLLFEQDDHDSYEDLEDKEDKNNSDTITRNNQIMFNFENLVSGGQGSYRVVYIHPEDEQKVIKVCRQKDPDIIRKCIQMMKDEVIASQRFPNLFPKVYNITGDGRGLVVERADILVEGHQDFLIDNYFPELRGYFIKSGSPDFMDFLKKIIDQYFNSEGRQRVFGMNAYDPNKYFKTSINKIIRRALTNQLFSDILQATIELGIEYPDFDWGNVGVSVIDRRFLIVDASMTSGFTA